MQYLHVFKTIFIFLSAIFIFAHATSYSQDKIETAQVIEMSAIGVKEVKLKNGMRILLKETDFETDEIIVRFVAQGGYGSLPAKKQISGQIAADVVWESGLGKYSADQICVKLYNHSIEFSTKIKTFMRVIEGTLDEEGLETFLELVTLTFTEPRFSEEGYQQAKKKLKTSFLKRPMDFDNAFEDAFMELNTQNDQLFRVKTADDIDQAELNDVKDFFQQSFSSPQDFVGVFVGSFDTEELIPLLEQYLGQIPINSSRSKLGFDHFKFPEHIVQTTVPLYSRVDTLTRITFPMTIKVNEKNVREIALTCQVLEVRLRKRLSEETGKTQGIDVAYEFPFYPYLYHPWTTVQFRADSAQTQKIVDIVLEEVKRIQKDLPSQDEILCALDQQKRSDEFWLRDNYFWSVALSNYSLWKWDPKLIHANLKPQAKDTPQTIYPYLLNLFPLNNYTVITSERKNK